MESSSSPSKTSFFSLEALGIVVGFSSVLAALAWFFGSMYYAGYFKALGIKGNFTTYSNEFLIGTGALRLFNPLFLTFYLYMFLVLEHNLSRDSAEKIILFSKRLKISNKAKLHIILTLANLIMIGLSYFSFTKIKNSHILSENLLLISVVWLVIALFFMDVMRHSFKDLGDSKDVKKYSASFGNFDNVFKAVIVSSLVFILFLSSLITEIKRGYQSGCEFINVNPTSITIYSQDSIMQKPPLDSNSISNNTNLYKFSGSLAEIGDEFLIVFMDTDSTTLLPNETYYIAKDEIASFVIKSSDEASSDKELVDKCKELSRNILQLP